MRNGCLIVSLLLLPCLLLAADYSKRSELENVVRYQMRMAGETQTVSAAQLRWFLHLASEAVDYKLRPYRAFDTVWTGQNVSLYALNDDCYENGVTAARVLLDSLNGTYRGLEAIIPHELGAKPTTPEDKTPYFYWTYGGYIGFDPTPQEVFRVEIEYEARSVPFSTADADSTDSIPTISPEHDQLIVDYTRYLIKKRLGLEIEAQAILQQWKTDMAEARALLMARPDPLVSTKQQSGS